MAFEHLNGKQRRAAIKLVAQENKKFGEHFQPISREKWHEEAQRKENLCEVWRNRNFCVQIYDEGNVQRLSINRTSINLKGEWNADISWEELQAIKNAVGFADRTAVEIFPPESDVINVANMRHLWITEQSLSFGWKNKN